MCIEQAKAKSAHDTTLIKLNPAKVDIVAGLLNFGNPINYTFVVLTRFWLESNSLRHLIEVATEICWT